MGRVKHRLLLVGLFAGFPLIADDTTQPLVFGVFPYLPPAQLEALYAPIAADFAETIGQPVQLRTRPSFELFSSELAKERYDLVFIQPFAYVSIAAPNNYRSISRPVKPLQAVFVAREDSTLTDIGGLRGQTLSNPPKSAAVSLLARQTLLEHQLQPGVDVHLTYQNNHGACLREVLIRTASACVTAAAPLRIFEAKSGVQFKTLGFSQSIPGSTYAVNERVPDTVRDALIKRITHWNETPSGQALLKSVKFPDFQASEDADYQPIRDILESLQSTKEPPPAEPGHDPAR